MWKTGQQLIRLTKLPAIEFVGKVQFQGTDLKNQSVL